MNRNREWRRTRRELAITRVERWLREHHFRNYDREERERLVEEHARKRHANRAPCSCWMCGNPRKWNREPTMAEKKPLDDY